MVDGRICVREERKKGNKKKGRNSTASSFITGKRGRKGRRDKKRGNLWTPEGRERKKGNKRIGRSC